MRHVIQVVKEGWGDKKIKPFICQELGLLKKGMQNRPEIFFVIWTGQEFFLKNTVYKFRDKVMVIQSNGWFIEFKRFADLKACRRIWMGAIKYVDIGFFQ